jgi:hypothetical protein
VHMMKREYRLEQHQSKVDIGASVRVLSTSAITSGPLFVNYLLFAGLVCSKPLNCFFSYR